MQNNGSLNINIVNYKGFPVQGPFMAPQHRGETPSSYQKPFNVRSGQTLHRGSQVNGAPYDDPIKEIVPRSKVVT